MCSDLALFLRRDHNGVSRPGKPFAARARSAIGSEVKLWQGSLQNCERRCRNWPEVLRLELQPQPLPHHHCGGGAYGATGATGAPYVTGAVAQGLQTGGGGAGQHATGAGRRSQLQQQQPALPRQRERIARMSDVLFMIVSPYE